MVKHYDLFWKALILTVVMFLLGVALGYVLEEDRINEIDEDYKLMEVEWADIKLLTSYYQNLDPKYCNAAIKENLDFADKVYQEGLKIERYETANFLTDALEVDKKKYALLKAEFWLNSRILKEKCNAKYTNLVYFFSNAPKFENEAQQNAQSQILKDLKKSIWCRFNVDPITN